MCAAPKLPTLPAPERAQLIVDRHRAGDSAATITTLLRATSPRGAVRGMVDRIVADVDLYDTFIDEVAVQRAYQGERDVWDALTHYERAACVDRVMARAEAQLPHMTWPGMLARDTGIGGGWLQAWSVAVGSAPDRFTRVLHGRRARERERA